MKVSSPTKIKGRGSCAFSLLEMLVVMNIVAWMSWFCINSLSSFIAAYTLTQGVANIEGVLERARTQAMLLNTYVYVGFFESDGALPETIKPAPSGAGRVWVGAVATKDGTMGCDPMDGSSTISSSNLMSIGKLQMVKNVHLSETTPFSSQGMITNLARIDSSLDSTNAPFGWPVDNKKSVSGFSTGVIRFDPRGTASIPGGSTTAECIQIALLPTRGKFVAAANINAAILQVDSFTGSIRTFRP